MNTRKLRKFQQKKRQGKGTSATAIFNSNSQVMTHTLSEEEEEKHDKAEKQHFRIEHQSRENDGS